MSELIQFQSDRYWRASERPLRPPSFNIYQPYPEMIKGGLLADAVAIIGGLNIIAGELDR